MKCIGISGPMGSGKTITGQIIAKMFHGPVHHHPFAMPLKHIANLMGWNGKKDEQGRRLLQLLGTECGRNCIDPDIWTKKWIEQVQGIENQNRLVIADDMRFYNECTTIQKYKGFLIKIAGRGEYSSHDSEQELVGHRFNIVVSNHLTIEQLEKTLKTCPDLLEFLNASTP